MVQPRVGRLVQPPESNLLLIYQEGGEMVSITPLFEMLSGFQASQLAGRNFYNLIFTGSERMQQWLDTMLTLLARQEPAGRMYWRGTLPLRNANGSIRWMHLNLGSVVQLHDRTPMTAVSLLGIKDSPAPAQLRFNWLGKLIRQLPFGALICTRQPEWKVLSFNRAFSEQTLLSASAGSTPLEEKHFLPLFRWLEQEGSRARRRTVISKTFSPEEWRMRENGQMASGGGPAVKVFAQRLRFVNRQYWVCYFLETAVPATHLLPPSETQQEAVIGPWQYRLPGGQFWVSPQVLELFRQVSGHSTDLLAETAGWHSPDLVRYQGPLLPLISGQMQQAIQAVNAATAPVCFELETGGRILQFSLRPDADYDLIERENVFQGWVSDQTARHQLTHALSHTRAQLSRLEQAAECAAWELNLLGETLTGTPHLGQLLQLPAERPAALPLSTLLRLVHPAELKKAEAFFLRPTEAHSRLLLNLFLPDRKIHQFEFEAVFDRPACRLSGTVKEVTGYLQHQQTLQAFENIVRSMSEAVIATNFLLEIKTWNQGAARLYGFDNTEVQGRKLQEVLFTEPNTGQHAPMSDFSQIFRELFSRGQWSGNFSQYHRDGTEFTVHSSISLLKDAEGQLVGLVMVNRDISSLLQAGRTTENSRRMLGQIFDSLPEAIFWVDHRLRLLGCNRVFALQIAGQKPEELTGKTLRQIGMVSGQLSQFEAEISQVLTSGQPLSQQEYAVQAPGTGEQLWLEASLLPLRARPEGPPQQGRSLATGTEGTALARMGHHSGVLVTLRDITARRQMEEQLRLQRADLSAIIENTDDGIAYLDQKLVLKRFNASFANLHETLFGADVQAGRIYTEVVPDWLALQMEEIFHYVSLGKKLVTEREMLIDKQFRWLEFACHPVMVSNQMSGYCFIVREISRRKKADKIIMESRISQEKVKALALMKGQDEERKRISMELHDGIGQHLTALQLQFNFLKNAYPAPEKEGKLQNQLEKLDQMLHHAKDEVRRVSFNLMPSMLKDFGLADTIRQLATTLFRDSDIEVFAEIKTDQMRFSPDLEVGLFRVTQEILNNAAKYSQASEVHIRLYADDAHLHLHIADNGIGFRQADLDQFKKKGNGLNNITQRISLLNGTVTLRTAENAGCSYEVVVPLGQQDYLTA